MQTPGKVSASKDKHFMSGFMSAQEHNYIYFKTQLPDNVILTFHYCIFLCYDVWVT